MNTLKFLLLFLFSAGVSAQEKVEVFFDFNQHQLTDTAVKTLNDFLETHKNAEVSKIFGFCDAVGSNAYNDTLSIKRVEAVHHYLHTKAVKIRKDYEVKGFGEDFRQSEVQAENRKVLIVFEDKPVAVAPVRQTLSDQVKSAKKGDKIKLENIYFLNNSATIVPRSKPVLNDLLCLMEDNPTLKIEIQGHICCRLAGDSNNVSTARARAIYNFLVRNKIDKKRLSFKGFGVRFPIYEVPEKSVAEEDANRRVEIMIVEN